MTVNRCASRLLLPCLVLLAVSFSSASAFDGQRKGFVFGYGVGASTMFFFNASDVGEGTRAFQTDLKIGRGLSEQVMVYYTGKQFFIAEDDEFFTGAMPSIGFSYYLNPESRSVFLAAGAGVMLAAFVADDFVGAGVGGVSIFTGIGYEVTRHWYRELDIIGVSLISSDFALGNVALTLNVLAF